MLALWIKGFDICQYLKLVKIIKKKNSCTRKDW
jgi:hypothetical protein